MGHPVLTIRKEDQCAECGQPLCNHNRVRNYPDDGPAGTYHYEYECQPEAIEAKTKVEPQ